MAEGVMENWGAGDPYEQYVGRWSRKVAREFLAWLQVTPGKTWGDVGCGTGALTETILAELNPESIAATDRSEGLLPRRAAEFLIPECASRSATLQLFPGRANHAM